MLQGIMALVMSLSIVAMGARAVSQPQEVWQKRAQARGSNQSEPSVDEIRRIKDLGGVGIVIGLIGAVVALILTIHIASLESDRRDLERERGRLGALAEHVPPGAV